MVSLISLIVILSLSLLVTRIATVLLVYTGLSRETAAFQARSAFTGVGFTTSEAESVVDHPVRRRIIRTLMLIGNAGVVSAMASLILTFVGQEQVISWYWKVGILAGSVAVLWAVATSRFVDRQLQKVIASAVQRYTSMQVRDYASLLHLSEDYEIRELLVGERDWLANKRLIDLRLRQEGINVLGVKRTSGEYIGVPNGESIIQPGDILLLYGCAGSLKELEKRRADHSGDVRHDQAVQQQHRDTQYQGK